MESPDAQGTPMTIRWSGRTDAGRFRQDNQDAFLALTFDSREVRYLGASGEASMDEADFVFAVSDGMGGAKSGEVASKIAVEKITRLLPASFQLGAQRLDAGFSDVMRELYLQSHDAMTELSRHYEECRGMGATLSLCWFMPGWMGFGHVGDSRIYYLPKDREMQQITHDHSHVGWLLREGKINEREAHNHPRKHILNQVLGGGNRSIDPQIGRVACGPGDRFLICSDGLNEGLWDRRLDSMARAEFDAKLLTDYAVGESGRDNTTAMLIEVN